MRRVRAGPRRAVTWIYVAWSLLPVLLAIRFAFNEGRSRTSAQGFSLRWFWTDPTLACATTRRWRRRWSTRCVLAGLAMLIATPLGRRAGDRPAALARPRRGRVERADAAAAGDAGAGVRGRPVPAVHVGVRVHRARHDGAGDRARDVLAVVGGADRARAAGDDRQRRRGGRGRPRRAAVGPCCGACCCRCWRRRSRRPADRVRA